MTANPFETSATIYDQWYDEFPQIFHSEVLALRALLPPPGLWVEIGVGTGRFAEQLGIPMGIEPTDGMTTLALDRGINVIRGVAEDLPLESTSQDAVFFITTLCFVQDIHKTMAEAYRVLKLEGHCIIGLLPLDSRLGLITQAQSEDDLFFRNAHLRTKADVIAALELAGFELQASSQTLFGDPKTFALCSPVSEQGHDRGSFVVFRATKVSQKHSAPAPSA